MDSLEGSANDAMTAEINRRVNKAIRDKIELDVRYISSNADIWYFINSCLNSGLEQVVATFYAAGGPGRQKDSVEFLKYLDRTYKDLNTDLRAVTTLRTLR
ncbi:pol-like protein [Colletotrichum kahawae]|uniref:Pol-like protein n=1 Tax=Colletotrichum kahawae TaxID=34407 RepID=A0AAD9XY73_COLKA|nr:pol-like protein [Colletotrichum kahawae]